MALPGCRRFRVSSEAASREHIPTNHPNANPQPTKISRPEHKFRELDKRPGTQGAHGLELPSHPSDDVAPVGGEEGDGSRHNGPHSDGGNRRSDARGAFHAGYDVGDGRGYPLCGFADRLYG